MDRMQVFSRNELRRIHDASMQILGDTGVKFMAPEAVEIFKKRGFRTDGARVFFTEKQVDRAIGTTPSKFEILARNPEKNVIIGEDHFVFVPTASAPNVMGNDGEMRMATFADYENACRMVQTSDQLDMMGMTMVQPGDIPAETAHLEMMLANYLFCDKASMGTGVFGSAAQDCLEMAAIVAGGKEALMENPHIAVIINAMSPLKYADDQLDSLMIMASYGQPVVITNLVMAGMSGPVSLPGLIALANAEILAGLVLIQLINPGTPMVYGSVSAPTDMRTITSAVGAPESVTLASATVQMANYYHLPCRTGGMITNAHCPDAQAAAEGTLMMSTALRNGANFIFHACGQLGSYISMSFEKWLLDEEVCRMLRRTLTSMDITVESIDLETIKTIGSDGSYLSHPSTFKHCRDFYQPQLFTRKDYHKWKKSGGMRVSEIASQMLPERLESFVKPPIDQGLEDALREYVTRRKKEY
ncbi:MttB3 [Desulfamplus magnetovallimortis]|uniref:Methyltransferase n=1 Tax=Desulfamplus magnetovallimortis TaxID=1246637 RepID=A0A1W1HFQ3_9BACT|nr:trimethylamine methyltransferase family protein [Desulfamplus magnetovallimortis]SLM31309.1 MttB3 [Desulfamplus magnetovallimortis]